ncbi:MAG TPA: hypothetical protein EYP10_04105, partial [Armatimonadetes bacterium]|nr:hypothetical protein [Armatimonadota bacterium]
MGIGQDFLWLTSEAEGISLALIAQAKEGLRFQRKGRFERAHDQESTLPPGSGEFEAMSTLAAVSKAKRKQLRIMNKLGFLYFTLLLVYTHAIAYRLLEYYVPQSGRFLTLSITLLLTTTLYTVLLKIFVRKRIPGSSPMAFLLLYMMVGILSLVNMYLYFGTVDFSQFTIGFYKSVLPITLVFLAYFSVYSISQGFRLLYSIAGINTLLGAIGIITYLIGERWTEYYLKLPQIEKLPLHFGGVLRMTSVLWNPLVFGILMALNSIMVWNIILHHRKARFLWFAMFTVSVIGTFASFTRTAWLLL